MRKPAILLQLLKDKGTKREMKSGDINRSTEDCLFGSEGERLEGGKRKRSFLPENMASLCICIYVWLIHELSSREKKKKNKLG